MTTDWPRFNGPNDNASSPESHLLRDWGDGKPEVLWELTKGEGYASPAVAQGILVLFHRKEGMEIIEGLNSETGQILWAYKYPVEYRDRYGYSNGPRSSPVINDNYVYAHGVTSWLSCIHLKTGKLIWKRDLKNEFGIPDYFFGKGSNPIIFEKHLILNVGGSNNRCVVAFNKLSGKTEWICKDPWGASYSSPTITTIQKRTVCLVLTGGESRPPTGGLLVIDPKTGEKLNRFNWRSSNYESANAVPPVPCGDDKVFLSECYEIGGVLLKYDKDFKPSIIWKNPEANIHWMTPIIQNSTMYGIAGRHQQGAETFALNIKTGTFFWKEPITWTYQFNDRLINLGLFRGSILQSSDGYICLSELGTLLKIDLTKNGWKLRGKSQLFFAPGTWTLPALSKGLLYVMQNETDRRSGKTPRILCYNLRAI
ncbi:MAG: PQQ-binding-like beta-propeller repeat protein [Opitutae bacterium]|nr:PQQ-binding-like beta-propeller repeat protein [Opitutae bacterium]MBT5717258.1 PQQ-binding-like beta-propeller repeat protein [Opitutae bacterium]